MSDFDMAGIIFKYIRDTKWNLKFHKHVFFALCWTPSFQRIFNVYNNKPAATDK